MIVSLVSPGKLIPECTILDFIGTRLMEVVVTAGAVRHANLASDRQQQQQQQQQPISSDWIPFLMPTQQHKNTEGRKIYSTDLLTQKISWVFYPCLDL